MYTERRNQREVVRASENALQLGVYSQMSLSVAHTLCPEMISYRYDPEAEFSLLQKIALWCLTISPTVGIDSEYLTHYLKREICSPLFSGIIIDLSGTERLHKGEERLISSIEKVFAKRGLAIRIAISSTIGKAWAHARFAPRVPFIDTSDSSSDTLSERSPQSTLYHYPIAALRLSEQLESQIAELGIKTIGQIFALPRKSLLKRFGDTLIERIEQFEGTRMEFIQQISPAPSLVRTHNFEVPSNSSYEIAARAEPLYGSLTNTLALEDKAPRSITVFLFSYPSQNIIWQRELFFFRRTTTKEFYELLLSYLENNRTIRDVCKIQMAVLEAEQLLNEQPRFDGSVSRDSDRALRGFIGAISNRMGRSAIQQARVYDSHLPEESIGFEPIDSKLIRSPSPNYTIEDQPTRPSLFFHPGEPIRVLALLPDHPPKRMYLGQQMITIMVSFGPEKIEEPWFSEKQPSLRDYFRVCDSHGRWLWVCHHRREKRWMLCGVWV